MDEQRQDDQLEATYNSSVPIQDIALKTSRERWTDRDKWQERVREICAGSQRDMMMMILFEIELIIT